MKKVYEFAVYPDAYGLEMAEVRQYFASHPEWNGWLEEELEKKCGINCCVDFGFAKRYIAHNESTYEQNRLQVIVESKEEQPTELVAKKISAQLSDGIWESDAYMFGWDCLDIKGGE